MIDYPRSALFAAAFALSCMPALTTETLGPDVGATTGLSMQECLDLQAAKNTGASRSDLKKACRWTTDENGSNSRINRYSRSRADRSRAVDSMPYGELPDAGMPPPP
jgi:hypothetical protein